MNELKNRSILPKKAAQLRAEARGLREMADQIEEEAYKMVEEQAIMNIRKTDDKLINRKEALSLLWFNSYPSLRRWEEKLKPFGYLEFTEDKILRSEVLRFLDDYHSGKINRKLYKKR